MSQYNYYTGGYGNLYDTLPPSRKSSPLPSRSRSRSPNFFNSYGDPMFAPTGNTSPDNQEAESSYPQQDSPTRSRSRLPNFFNSYGDSMFAPTGNASPDNQEAESSYPQQGYDQQDETYTHGHTSQQPSQQPSADIMSFNVLKTIDKDLSKICEFQLNENAPKVQHGNTERNMFVTPRFENETQWSEKASFRSIYI